MRVTVEGESRGVEEDDPVEDGEQANLTLGHRSIPELQLSAVVFVPVLVQEDQ
jgi:hypothetical protein